MKKIFLSLFILLTGLAGCGSDTNAEKSNVESISIAVESKYMDWMKPHADAYTQQTGIEIEMQEVDSWFSVVESLAQTIPAGQAPDLVPMSYDNFASTVEPNLIVPINTDGFEDTYGTKALDTVSYNGEAYLYPLQLESLVLYYDKTKMDYETANSIDVSNLQELIDLNNEIGFSYAILEGYQYIPLIGEEVFDNGEAPTKINITSDTWIERATMLQELIKDYPTTLKDASQSSPFSVEMFVNKEVGALMSGPWSYAQAKEAYGNDLGIAQLNGLTPFTGLVGYASTNTGDEVQIAAAQDFAKYITSEAQTDFYEMTNYIPVSKQGQEPISSDDDYAQMQIKGFENSIPMVKSPIGSDVWLPLQTAMINIANGEDVETSLQAAADEIKSAGTKYGLEIE